MFPGDHDIDVMAAAQAMVHHRQQAVGIRREVDAHHFRLLVHDMIDEPGVLMREAVVILPPDMRGQQVIQRVIFRRHGRFAVTFSHLACWLNIESTM